MSMRQYDIPTENGWASLRVQLEGREYSVFVDNELYETFPDIASSLTLPVGQMVVEIKFRTPKNHRVLVNGTPLKKVQKEFARQHKMWKFCLDGSETNFAYERSTKQMFMNGEEIKMATFGDFSFFDRSGNKFHFWDSTRRPAELKMGDEIVPAYQLKNG